MFSRLIIYRCTQINFLIFVVIIVKIFCSLYPASQNGMTNGLTNGNQNDIHSSTLVYNNDNRSSQKSTQIF